MNMIIQSHLSELTDKILTIIMMQLIFYVDTCQAVILWEDVYNVTNTH